MFLLPLKTGSGFGANVSKLANVSGVENSRLATI